MTILTINKIKRQKAVLTSVAFLMLASSLSQASYYLREDDQKQIISAHLLPSYIDGSKVEIAITDDHFDPNSDTRNALSVSTRDVYNGMDQWFIAYKAHVYGKNHANHVASSIHNIASASELRVIDLNNEPALKDEVSGNARLIKALDEAVKSRVVFLNLSLRIAPDGDWDGKITEDVKAAFLRARDAGIGIIKSAGNDQEFTGSTPYTRSLVGLLEEMDGSMILAAATEYNSTGQFEKLAEFKKGEIDWQTGKVKLNKLPRGSNYAGLAHEYTVSAPGQNNYACGAGNQKMVMSGTSMAAPIVTGTAALIKSAHPSLTSREVLSYILKAARTTNLDDNLDLPAGKYGRGIIDVANSLQMIKKDMQ